MGDKLKRFNFKFGQLNSVSKPNVGRSYDPNTTSGVDVIKQNNSDSLSPNALSSRGSYRAVALTDGYYVATPAKTWVSDVFGDEQAVSEEKMAVVGYIPELHGASYPNPFDFPIKKGKLDQKVVSMFPVFVATEEVSDVPKVGDIISVDFNDKENLEGGIYLEKSYKSPLGLDEAEKAQAKFLAAKKAQNLQKSTATRASATVGQSTPNTAPDQPPDASITEDCTDGENWSGNAARWSQAKKYRSMNPRLRPKVKQVISGLKRRGFQPKIFFAWRSLEAQRRIYDRGHSKVLFSFHTATLDGCPNSYAADIVDKRWGWEDPAEQNGFWQALGEEAERAGLYWGGNWRKFKDVAHVQLYPNSQLAAVKKESNYSAVV